MQQLLPTDSSCPDIIISDEWWECRSGVSTVPVSTWNNDNTTSTLTYTLSRYVKRYHCRRHRYGVPLPSQLHRKPAPRTLQKSRILLSTFSVAQSSRPAVTTSEERSSGSLLTFSYAPPLGSGEDGAADGGRAYSSGGDSVDSRERLRRDRIARANKGRVPWNKGRRHSPGIHPIHRLRS